MKQSILFCLLAASGLCVSSCDKPTSGQNTRDYRDGESGAASQTIKNDTPLDSTAGDEDKRK